MLDGGTTSRQCRAARAAPTLASLQGWAGDPRAHRSTRAPPGPDLRRGGRSRRAPTSLVPSRRPGQPPGTPSPPPRPRSSRGRSHPCPVRAWERRGRECEAGPGLGRSSPARAGAVSLSPAGSWCVDRPARL